MVQGHRDEGGDESQRAEGRGGDGFLCARRIMEEEVPLLLLLLLLLLMMMMMKACLPDLHLDTLDIDPARANKRVLLVCSRWETGSVIHSLEASDPPAIAEEGRFAEQHCR